MAHYFCTLYKKKKKKTLGTYAGWKNWKSIKRNDAEKKTK